MTNLLHNFCQAEGRCRDRSRIKSPNIFQCIDQDYVELLFDLTVLVVISPRWPSTPILEKL